MLAKNQDSFNLKRLCKYRLPVIESVEQFLDIAGLKDREKRYFFSENRKFYIRSVPIPKKDGNYRIIEIPPIDLVPVLKAIDKVLLRRFEMPEPCCAYLNGKSIIDNALPHVGAKTLLKFDIHDFFPSITLKRIVCLFRNFGYGPNVSRYFGYLCTNHDNVLPQGYSTSPMLSNLVSVRLDSRIMGFCKKYADEFSLKYTRYADDITISSKKRLSSKDICFIKKVINTIIFDEGFSPNEQKFKHFVNGQKMLVTGINVNDSSFLHVDKKKIREIEIAIHCMDKYGIDSHIERINGKNDDSDCYWERYSYERHIFGLAFYIKMIDYQKGEKYINELKRIFAKDE